MRRGDTSSFYCFDYQGSTRLLLSLAGAVTDSYLGTAFGVEIAASGSTVNAFRFGGLSTAAARRS